MIQGLAICPVWDRLTDSGYCVNCESAQHEAIYDIIIKYVYGEAETDHVWIWTVAE